MTYETLIAAYESDDRATAAVQALRRLGVPRTDIKRHPVSAAGLNDVAPASLSPPEHGFWSWLLGQDTVDRRIAAYERALERGGVVISVNVLDESVDQVRALLEEFGPVEMDVGELA